jgi:RNA-directed DNA polymerase
VVSDDPFRDRRSYYSVRVLECCLDISRGELFAAAASAGASYSPFKQVKKLKPFPKFVPVFRKARDIDNPVACLKSIQTRIYHRMLKPLVLPTYLCGGAKGRTIAESVAMHLGEKTLVTADIKSFFPLISNIQVFRVWRDLLKFSPKISGILTRLTTFQRHLPQGAPTSTLLANLVLHNIDEPIREACRKLAINYSTWIDDLAFSGENPQQIIPAVTNALSSAGLGISHKKLHIMGPGDRKILLGIVLNRLPNVRREYLSDVRSGIHKVRTNCVPNADLQAYVASLEGKIRHIAAFAPRRGQRLSAQLQNAVEKSCPQNNN